MYIHDIINTKAYLESKCIFFKMRMRKKNHAFLDHPIFRKVVLRWLSIKGHYGALRGQTGERISLLLILRVIPSKNKKNENSIFLTCLVFTDSSS